MIFKNLLIPLCIAFLLGTEGIFTGFSVGGMPYVRIATILVFLLIFTDFVNDIKINKLLFFFEKFVLVLLLFLFLKLCVFVFIKSEEFEFIILEISRLIFYGIFIYIGYFMINKNILFLNVVIFINLLIFVIAFFQSELTPLTDVSQDLKTNYFSQNNILDLSEASLFSRISGLYAFCLILDYALISNSLILLYMYIKTKLNIYFMFFLFNGIVILLTQTRSTMIGWLFLLIYWLLYFYKTTGIIQKVFISIVLVCSISVFSILYAEYYDSLSRITDASDESAAGKFPLLITGLYALFRHPFGISEKEYMEVKKEMYAIYQNSDILIFPSHNPLVEFGFTYTLIGLLGFFLFVYVLLKRFLKPIDHKLHNYIKMSMIAYMANSFFHNMFVFQIDFFILIFFSILVYEYNLGYKYKASLYT